MALSTTSNRSDYIGDGATTAFTLPVLCYSASHVKVFVNGVLQTVGYTVTGVGNPSGITVTFSTAPSTGTRIALIREVPLTQETSYPIAGAFPAKTLERDLDLRAMTDQQFSEAFGRAIKIPLSSSAKNLDIPDPNDPLHHGKVFRLANATTIDMIDVQPGSEVNLLTTKGDLLTHTGGTRIRKPVGADGQILEADSASTDGLTWGSPPIKKEIVQAKGDLIVATGANNPVRLGGSFNAMVLTTQGSTSTGLAWAWPYNGGLWNGFIAVTVASNAMTLRVKANSGHDPSSSDPVFVAMPSSAVTDGTISYRAITAPLSLTIPAGATLGHVSNRLQHVFVYALDVGGTIELAVSNLPPDYENPFGSKRLVSTTAISGSSTSPTTVYSETARTNVPWAPLAMIRTIQPTAGQWTSDPVLVATAPFALSGYNTRIFLGANQTVPNNTFTTIQYTNVTFDDLLMASSNGVMPILAGYYFVRAGVQLDFATGHADFYLRVMLNGVQNAIAGTRSPSTTTVYPEVTALVKCNGTTDTIAVQLLQNTGADQTLIAGIHSHLSVMRVI